MDVIVGKNRKGEVRTIPTFDPGWSPLKKLDYWAGLATAEGTALVTVEPASEGSYRVLVNGHSVGALDYLEAAMAIQAVRTGEEA